MKQVTINIYKFHELSDKAKQHAINTMADINTDYDWCDYVYEDAATIGLKITGFDIGRANYVTAQFDEEPETVAKNIIAQHGGQSTTIGSANVFLRDKDEEEFLNNLQEDYRIMLSQEYEYATSDEAIIETIEANEYDFTEKGELY